MDWSGQGLCVSTEADRQDACGPEWTGRTSVDRSGQTGRVWTGVDRQDVCTQPAPVRGRRRHESSGSKNLSVCKTKVRLKVRVKKSERNTSKTAKEVKGSKKV